MSIFRFRKDQEFGKIRQMQRSMTPATVPLFVSMKPGDKRRSIRLGKLEIKMIESMNDKQALQYLTGTAGGWVNAHTYPIVEQVGFEDNLFEGVYIDNNWTLVFTHKLGSISIPNNPYHIQKWYNIKRNGIFTKGKSYLHHSKILLVSVNGYLFVESKRVQLIKQ